jgi:hypothetical protein
MKAIFLLLSLLALSLSQSLDFDSSSDRELANGFWLEEGTWTADVSGRSDLNNSVIEFSLSQAYSGFPCYYTVWVDDEKVSSGTFTSVGGSVIALLKGTVDSLDSELTIKTSNCWLGRYAVPFLFHDPNDDGTTPSRDNEDENSAVYLVDITPLGMDDLEYEYERYYVDGPFPTDAEEAETFMYILGEADGNCAFSSQACSSYELPDAQRYFLLIESDFVVDLSHSNPETDEDLIVEFQAWSATSVDYDIYYCNNTDVDCLTTDDYQEDDVYFLDHTSSFATAYDSTGDWGKSATGMDELKYSRYFYKAEFESDLEEAFQVWVNDYAVFFPYVKVWDLAVTDDPHHILYRLDIDDHDDDCSQRYWDDSNTVSGVFSYWDDNHPFFGEMTDFWNDNYYYATTQTSVSYSYLNLEENGIFFCPVAGTPFSNATLTFAAAAAEYNSDDVGDSDTVATASFTVSGGFVGGWADHPGWDHGFASIATDDGAYLAPAWNLHSAYDIIVTAGGADNVVASVVQHIVEHPTENSTTKGAGSVNGFHFGANLTAGTTITFKSWPGYSMSFQPFVAFHSLPEAQCVSENNCSDRGACASKVGLGCVCNEPALWMGDECDELVQYCTPNTCYNGGKCSESEDRVWDAALGVVRGATTCDCSETAGKHSGHPFTGDKCEVLPLCEFQPCLHQGVCNEDGTCDCADTTSPISGSPYTGDHCEISADQPCDLNPCQNDGECENQDDGSFECKCNGGWLGAICSIPPVDKCVAEHCGDHGYCIPSTSEDSVGIPFTRCVCVDGWHGDACDQLPAPCEPNPCQNEGVCISEAHQVGVEAQVWGCLCVEPWVGVNCQWNATQWSAAPTTTFTLFSTLLLAFVALLF